MTGCLDFHFICGQQLCSVLIGAVFAAVCALPMLLHAVCCTGRILCGVMNPVVTGCRYDRSLRVKRNRAVPVSKTFTAAAAFPMLRLAVLSTGCLICIPVNQRMTEGRYCQICICQQLGTLFIRKSLAAAFAFPVCSRTGMLAVSFLGVMLHERMCIRFDSKGFLTDVTAFAGEMIVAFRVAGAGFVILSRYDLVDILVQ